MSNLVSMDQAVWAVLDDYEARAAREEKLVGAQAYGFDVHFAIEPAGGRTVTVVRRHAAGFLPRDGSLLGRALRPPPHRRPIPLSHRSHCLKKPP